MRGRQGIRQRQGEGWDPPTGSACKGHSPFPKLYIGPGPRRRRLPPRSPDHEVRSRPVSRLLIRIEEGYPSNPYHCRTHAADVLRSLHVVLNRGGVMTAVTAASGRSQPHEENRRQSITEGFASQVQSLVPPIQAIC